MNLKEIISHVKQENVYVLYDWGYHICLPIEFLPVYKKLTQRMPTRAVVVALKMLINPFNFKKKDDYIVSQHPFFCIEEKGIAKLHVVEANKVSGEEIVRMIIETQVKSNLKDVLKALITGEEP